MIPAFNHSHVLPPFVGDQLSHAESSPYPVTAGELVSRFAVSPERRTILRGLLDYRAALRGLGFSGGFQWLDGSFVENVEAARGRPPADIDLVTFVYAPSGLSPIQTRQMMDDNAELFVKERCKARFRCDTMVINLGKTPERLVQDVRYWYGLFSHRRGDHIWKGMLHLPMDSDDEAASFMLNELAAGENNAAPT